MSKQRTKAGRRRSFREFINRPFVMAWSLGVDAATFRRIARRFAEGKVVHLPPESSIVAVFPNGETYIASTYAEGGDVVRERAP